jgi:SAM-dependent methyltransferase
MDNRKTRWRRAIIAASILVAASAAATAVSFPWSVDPQGDESFVKADLDYYKMAYAAGSESKKAAAASAVEPLSQKEQFYVDFARDAAARFRIPEAVGGFVGRFRLQDKKILEVGAGSGLLQDVVADYTGLDISPTARRFFHKPFVEASATQMPFADSSFDGLWSIWVLEHIPNCEKALLEMRRVVKPGGYLFLYPAWEVDWFAAQGYRVRPFSDFDWKGKMVKFVRPFEESATFHYLQYPQVRLLRSLSTRLGGGPSRLHFMRLTPNYDQYWVADSDATTSLSFHETYLWFASRGDTCLNCPSELDMVLGKAPLNMIIQVHKH